MPTQNKPNLCTSPVLLEIFRGVDKGGTPIMECVHHGLVSVMSGDGQTIFSYGDQNIPIHMRSTGKPWQILPILDPHTSKAYPWLKPQDLALFMSSHAGQALHTTRVLEILKQLGLKASDLRCGVHPPSDDETRHRLQEAHEAPSALHNNCSGKHSAMLLACLNEGFDIKSYEDPSHPLQLKIKGLIKEIADLGEDDIDFGIDGCSLPSWVLPIKNLALLYARLAAWQSQVPAHRPSWFKDAFRQIWASATNFPEYVAGDKRFDTKLIRLGAQQIVSKTGADGVQALSILPSKRYPHGLGIVIKVADGDLKNLCRSVIVKDLLEDLGLLPQGTKLDELLPSFKNYRGLQTGSFLNQVQQEYRRSHHGHNKGA